MFTMPTTVLLRIESEKQCSTSPIMSNELQFRGILPSLLVKRGVDWMSTNVSCVEGGFTRVVQPMIASIMAINPRRYRLVARNIPQIWVCTDCAWWLS
jgi:hypothetical protein